VDNFIQKWVFIPMVVCLPLSLCCFIVSHLFTSHFSVQKNFYELTTFTKINIFLFCTILLFLFIWCWHRDHSIKKIVFSFVVSCCLCVVAVLITYAGLLGLFLMIIPSCNESTSGFVPSLSNWLLCRLNLVF
jgi:glucan phosphoethanolaminetransferase (alkaline phosphatase superfamily)